MNIEKNIPIPPKRGSGRYTATVREMEVGDSVFLKSHIERSRFAVALARAGFKFTSRQVEGGYRIWKTGIKVEA